MGNRPRRAGAHVLLTTPRVGRGRQRGPEAWAGDKVAPNRARVPLVCEQLPRSRDREGGLPAGEGWETRGELPEAKSGECSGSGRGGGAVTPVLAGGGWVGPGMAAGLAMLVSAEQGAQSLVEEAEAEPEGSGEGKTAPFFSFF